LNHKALDDTVERASFEMERFSGFSLSLFSGAEASEILGCFGCDVSIQLHDHATVPPNKKFGM
jgi:hypothetical protein